MRGGKTENLEKFRMQQKGCRKSQNPRPLEPEDGAPKPFRSLSLCLPALVCVCEWGSPCMKVQEHESAEVARRLASWVPKLDQLMRRAAVRSMREARRAGREDRKAGLKPSLYTTQTQPKQNQGKKCVGEEKKGRASDKVGTGSARPLHNQNTARGRSAAVRGKEHSQEWLCHKEAGRPWGRHGDESIHCRRFTDQDQLGCWGCSARFCLISLTLSIRSSACFFRLARSSADSTISALRR